jgi:hypothetical protein
VHRRRDVLHLLFADIGELHRQLVGDLLVHGTGDADAADLGEAFQPRGDVDAVAEQIAVAFDHVADGDADAERHLPARRIGHVAGPQGLLDVDRAAHRVHRARKFREHGIAGGVEDAAVRLCDEIVDDFAVRGEAPQRLLLVFRHQPRIPGNIGCENRCDLAFHLPPAPGTKFAGEECRYRRRGATKFQRPPLP